MCGINSGDAYHLHLLVRDDCEPHRILPRADKYVGGAWCHFSS
jgi:hypothetical protein